VCVGVSKQFISLQQDNNTIIQQWSWNFGDAQQANIQNTTHTYKQAGNYNATLSAVATNGCASDTIAIPLTVHEASADAGRDTIVLNSVPFQLAGRGNGDARWSPATGLSRDDVLTPIGSLTDDQQYVLTITTPEGCIARDSVKIEVFKGSAVYVPTAFTPNGNGLNEILRPGYKGIKKLHYFTIYNRWGQQVFTTSDISRGWDGLQRGKPLGTGTFVWMLRAEDVVGKIYTLKGTFVLIR
jgi:gliding motility-associated-like protein